MTIDDIEAANSGNTADNSVTFSSGTKNVKFVEDKGQEDKNPRILKTTSSDTFATTPSHQNGAPVRRTNSSRLSAVSKKYDVNGDGYLDETEQAMRDMDEAGQGYLSNEIVYNLLREQVQLQKQLLNKKRIILVLFAVVIILALSNLGTAWAAAVLAKDISTQNNVLVVHGTNEAVATNSYSQVYKLEANAKRKGRALVLDGFDIFSQESQVQVGDLHFLPKSTLLDIMAKCQAGNSVTLERTLFPDEDYETPISMPLCPGGTVVQLSQHDFVITFPRTMIGMEPKQLVVTCFEENTCAVQGTALLLGKFMPCMQNDQCEYGYCHFGYGLPDDPGRCTCNPTRTENDGCMSQKTCFAEFNITEAQRISHAHPTCYYNTGDDCNGDYDCLSGNCVQPKQTLSRRRGAVEDLDLVETARCGCNPLSSFGCAEGQECKADLDGRYLCMG